jgi:hypothetical protein
VLLPLAPRKAITLVSATLPKSTELVAIVPGRAVQRLASSHGGFSELLAQAKPAALTGERLLGAEAMRLLMRLDRELLEARAHWNRDSFRRVMRARSKAVLRLQRRWARVAPTPVIPLGSLRRRYHANLAGHLYDPVLSRRIAAQ